MKLKSFELYHVRPRFLLLRIETDNGLYGWGEPTLEGQTLAVEAAVRQLLGLIQHEDLRQIEHIWQRMYRCGFYRGGPILCSAISGIEQALWDVLGKSLGVPVYQLLGGKVRDRIRMYGQFGGRRRETLLARFRKLQVKGLTMAKFCPWRAVLSVDSPEVVDRAVRDVMAVREAAGPDFDLAIDAHGRLSPAMAIDLSTHRMSSMTSLDALYGSSPIAISGN